MSVIALRYIGDGAYRPSLPARDLDADDIATVAAQQKRSVDELLAEALGCGLYRAIYDVEPEAVTAEQVPSAYDGLTKKELLALAAERGIEIPPRATNPAIVEALIAASVAAEGFVCGERTDGGFCTLPFGHFAAHTDGTVPLEPAAEEASA